MGDKIYRDYDQEGLDRQFNLRARWPEHPIYFAHWADASAALWARLGGHLDLAYGPSEGQRLDIFPARGSAGAVAGAPLICAVGSEETEIFQDQQRELVAAWRSAGAEVRVVDLPGRNHFTAVDALGEADHPLFAAVRDMCLRGT